jgi:hypothetical protein
MIVDQYEERFLRPAPSLHQTFAAATGRAERHRRRRIWAAAAAAAALAIIGSAGSHRGALGWIISHCQTQAVQRQILVESFSQKFTAFL